MLGRLKNVFLVLSKPQSQFGCQISNHFQKLPMDSWSLVSTFWSQCINSRHNTQSNTHNTWFLKHLCCFVAFWLKSFQHDMHKLTGSSASGLELVDLIYWQSNMLGDSSQTGRKAGRQVAATASQALRSSHPKTSTFTPQSAQAPLVSLWSSSIDLQRGHLQKTETNYEQDSTHLPSVPTKNSMKMVRPICCQRCDVGVKCVER